MLTAANEQLKSERLRGAELGVEGLLHAVGSLRLTGFVNVLTDPIANVTLAMPLPDGAGRQRQNLGRVTARGVDVTADGRLPLGLTLSLGYTLAHARVTAAPAQPDLVDKDVPQAPRHRARAALGWGWRQRVETNVQLRLQGRSFEDDLNTLAHGGLRGDRCLRGGGGGLGRDRLRQRAEPAGRALPGGASGRRHHRAAADGAAGLAAALIQAEYARYLRTK